MKRWVPLVLGAAMTPWLTGCSPPPKPVGLRIENGRVVAFVPLCPGDELARLRLEDNRGAGPSTWWSGPVTPGARSGRVYLDDPAQFATAEGPLPVPLPAQVYLVYETRAGVRESVAFDVADIPLAGHAPDEWWSRKGPRTEEQLVEDQDCEHR
jgi:hypothetical protein